MVVCLTLYPHQLSNAPEVTQVKTTSRHNCTHLISSPPDNECTKQYGLITNVTVDLHVNFSLIFAQELKKE